MPETMHKSWSTLRSNPLLSKKCRKPMPELDPQKQRQFAIDVVRELRDSGFESLWAGGCVRDMVLGLPAKDYDVATSATPDEVRNIFGKHRTLPIGASFGVITVLGPRGAGQIEVATFRSDLDYKDGRRPEGVVFTSAEQDAQRRDFTINGLFHDPLSGDIIDYVGGRQDIERRLVRAIGDAEARFGEDKLRMLRALRFAARFGFTIDGATRDAIERHAGDIIQVSGERIGTEMRAMLLHPSRGIALEQLFSTQLMGPVFKELSSLDSATLDARLNAAAGLHEPRFATVLATLLLDNPAANSSTLASRWKLTNQEASDITWLLEHHAVVSRATSLPWPQVQRTLADERATELVAMTSALAGAGDPHVEFCHERLAWPREMLDPPRLVTGRDLIEAGIEPGPTLGTLLERIRDEQLEGRLTDKSAAIRFAISGGA
jgi:poly(A) polymerase